MSGDRRGPAGTDPLPMYEWTSGYGAGNLIYTDADTFGWPLDYLNPLHPPKADWEFFRFGGNDYNVGVTGVFGQ